MSEIYLKVLRATGESDAGQVAKAGRWAVDALEQAKVEIKRYKRLIPFECCEGGNSDCYGPGGCLLRAEKQLPRIEQLEEEATKVIQLLRDVGIGTNWADRSQTDRVFAWYEFDGLREALGERESAGDSGS